MPHQCVHCGKIYPSASKELLEGCSECHGHFFFFIKEAHFEKMKEESTNVPFELPIEDKVQVEKDIREIAGITDEQAPVILDIESVRVAGSGKFEIDLVNLFRKDRPLIYKLEEGKYIIDLTTTLDRSMKELKEIKNPDETE